MKSKYNIAFIIGQGRSGTHLVARCLDNSRDTVVNIESGAVWRHSVNSCRHYGDRFRYVKPMISEYKKLIRPFKLFIDKSHTNIWNVPELRQAFPRAAFISIYRDPLAVVSSMLKHGHTARWCREWRKYGVPNPFTGVCELNAKEYEDMPIESKCTMKWISHFKEAKRLVYDRDVITIKYERLISRPSIELGKVYDFLNITPGKTPKIIDTRNKWEDHLSPVQVSHILETIEKYDPDNPYLEGHAKR